MRKLSLLMFVVVGLAAANVWAAVKKPLPIKIEVCRQKEALVQLWPNPSYSGTLSVKSVSRDPLHFYVFDVEGTMVYHALLLPGNRRSIDALKAGVYSYDVFRNDESVEQGKISVQLTRKVEKPRIAK